MLVDGAPRKLRFSGKNGLLPIGFRTKTFSGRLIVKETGKLVNGALIGAAMLLSACTTVTSPPDRINPTLSSTPVPPTAGFVSWRLPKTVIDATVTFKYVGCTPAAGPNGTPVLELERTVALVARGVPDDDIYGPRKPGEPFDPMVSVPMSALTSFWDDRSLTVKHAPNGTLTSIGAIAEDQTAAIVGNVLTSATKIGSIAFGVPPAGLMSDAAQCSQQPSQIKAEIERLKALLRDPATTDAARAAYNLQLADQEKKRDKLTITVTRTIDPGVTPPMDCELVPSTAGCPGRPAAGVADSGLIATILPSWKELETAGWMTGTRQRQLEAVTAFAVSVFLDFSKATPPILATCSGGQSECPRRRTMIDRTTQFREVAYIPLIVVAGEDRTSPTDKFELTVNGGRPAGPIPFAQFGIPRALPIKAGTFEKIAWTFSFNEFGEPIDVAFGSAAIGSKASSLLQSAASAGATLASQERTADGLASSETLRLQREAVELKAKVDLAKLRAEADLLRTQGYMPE